MSETIKGEALQLITNVDDIPESTKAEFDGAKGDEPDESHHEPAN